MGLTDPRTERVAVELSDGEIISVEIEQVGRQDVASGPKNFRGFRKSLSGIVREIAEPIQEVQPSKATIKFGLDISTERGKLIASVPKGSEKANFEITLEWTNDRDLM